MKRPSFQYGSYFVFFLSLTILCLQLIFPFHSFAQEQTMSPAPGLSLGVIAGYSSPAFPNGALTPAQLKARFAEAQAGGKKVKILVVPGHDDQYVGTSFRGVDEGVMTGQLGAQLAAYLREIPEFDVMLARTNIAYNDQLVDFFESQQAAIRQYITDVQHSRFVPPTVPEEGTGPAASSTPGVPSEGGQVQHNVAPSQVAFKLFGINKYANDNGFDFVIHVHFDDFPNHAAKTPGSYNGFVIYIPEMVAGNASSSKAIAQSIFSELTQIHAVSDLPIENQGIVPDSQLIADGVSNSLLSAVALIEYGYIYEPMYTAGPITRAAALKERAFRTFRGIEDFFGIPAASAAHPYASAFLPYVFPAAKPADGWKTADVMALQAALIDEGVFPPSGKDLRACPMSADIKIDSCTKAAIAQFQEKYGITPAVGNLGPITLKKLNSLYRK